MEWWLETAAFVVLMVALILLFSRRAKAGSWTPFIAALLVSVVIQGTYQTFSEPLRHWVALDVLVLALAALAAQWRTIAASLRANRAPGWRSMLFGRR